MWGQGGWAGRAVLGHPQGGPLGPGRHGPAGWARRRRATGTGRPGAGGCIPVPSDTVPPSGGHAEVFQKQMPKEFAAREDRGKRPSEPA